jgi:hypothetical protein
MAYPAELAGSSIEVKTRLSGPRLAEISEYVAETVAARGALVRYEGAESGRTMFSVRDTGSRAEDMTFHVAIANRNPRGSTGRTRIDSYAMMPLTPDHTACYALYTRFMRRFGDIVRIEDPAAEVSINDPIGVETTG